MEAMQVLLLAASIISEFSSGAAHADCDLARSTNGAAHAAL